MTETRVHARNIVEWGATKPDVVVLSGDLTGSVELSDFKEQVPDKFFSLGMAEQNMLSWAGGMAREGYVPLLHTFSVFLTRRPYDQLAMSVCYPNLPVILVGFLPGIMTPGGVTHQAIEDISLMRGLPNMTVLEVGDATEVESALEVAYQKRGPVYIRMLRGAVPRLFDTPMELDKVRVLSEGSDIAIFSSGICTEQVIRARKAIEDDGIGVTHVHVSTLKPFNDPRIDEVIRSVGTRVYTVENHNVIGGLGTAVAERMAALGGTVPLTRIGIPDTFGHGATAAYLMRKFGIDARGVVDQVAADLGRTISISDDELAAVELVPEVDVTQLEAL